MTKHWIEDPLDTVLAKIAESREKQSTLKYTYDQRQAERNRWKDYSVEVLAPTQGPGGDDETIHVPTKVNISANIGYGDRLSVEFRQGSLCVSARIEPDTRLDAVTLVILHIRHENGAPRIDVKWKPTVLDRTLPIMAAVAAKIRPVMDAAYRAWLNERDAARAKRLTPGQVRALIEVLETGFVRAKGTKARVAEHLLTLDYLTVAEKWPQRASHEIACTVNADGRAALHAHDPDTNFDVLETTRIRITADRAVQAEANKDPKWDRASRARAKARDELVSRLRNYNDTAHDEQASDPALTEAHQRVTEARLALRQADMVAGLTWATAWGDACRKHVPADLSDPVCPSAPAGSKW